MLESHDARPQAADRPVRLCRQRYPAEKSAASRTANIPSPIRHGFAKLSRPMTNTGRSSLPIRAANGSPRCWRRRSMSTRSAPACSPSSSSSPASRISCRSSRSANRPAPSSLTADGGVIAAPDPDADELNALKANHPLLPVAVDAIRQARTTYNPDDGEAFHSQVSREGKAYQAVLTPISFPGWSLVTVVPESEFLGPVRMTIRNLLIGLAVLIVFAGLLSAWLAQRLIAAPLIKVMGEIRHVERFDLDKVERHPSRLTEIENLSGAISDMAHGTRRIQEIYSCRSREAAGQRGQRRAVGRRRCGR